MRKFFTYLTLVLATSNAMAADVFNPATNVLTLDSVVVGGTVYSNVAVKINSFEIQSVGSSAPYTPVSATCSASNFTAAKYDAITLGMTLEQVFQVIGCKNTPSLTTVFGTNIVGLGWAWTDPVSFQMRAINVWFDATGSIVTKLPDTDSNPYFKSRTGF